MKASTKIWLAIAGILLIALGIMCLKNPVATLLSLAWVIGAGTLLTGIAKLVFTIRTQAFLPNSGTRMLSAILLIVLGFVLLGHKFFVTSSLPIIFAVWVVIEGITIAVQSFDYKKVGFGGWWALLLFGIAAAILGCMGLRNPLVAAHTLSILISAGIIVLGASYLLALLGIQKFERIARIP